MFFYIDKKGNALFAEKGFKWAGPFSDGLACVQGFDGVYFIINKSGDKVLTLPSYQSESVIVSESFVAVRNRHLYGYVDLKGETVIPLRFLHANPFRNHRALVRSLERKFQFINSKAEIVHQRECLEMEVFTEGVSLFKTKEGYFYQDENFEVILGPYKQAGFFSEERALVVQEKAIVIDKKGRRIFELPRDCSYGGCYNGRIKYSDDKGRYGFFSNEGEVVIVPRFNEASSFKEGVAVVKIGKKSSIIDLLGDKKCDLPSSEYGSVSEGLLPIRSNGKVGYVDLCGNWIIPPTFQFAFEFSEGYAVAVLDE